MNHHSIRFLALSTAVALTACTGSTSDTSDGTENTAVDVPAPDTSSEPDSIATASTSAPTPPTSSTTTSTSTTVPAPPAPTGVVSVQRVDDGLERGRIDVLGDAAASGDGAAMVVVGNTAAAPGEMRTAVVNVGNGIDPFNEVLLDHGDAVESFANAVFLTESTTYVAGSTVAADGLVSAVVWTSTDGAASFGPPVEVIAGPSFASDVIAWDGGIAVAGTADVAADTRLVVATSVDGRTWTDTEIDTPGARPEVGGMVRSGERIVLLGTSDVDGRSIASAWTSDDDAATFAVHADPELAASTSVGPPAAAEGRVVAMAGRPGGEPTQILESDDGIAWTPVDLASLGSALGAPVDLGDALVGPIVGGSDLLFGTTTAIATIVSVADELDVAFSSRAPYTTTDVFERPIPLVVGESIFAVAPNWAGNTWRVARVDLGTEVANPTVSPDGAPEGPGPDFVEVTGFGEQILARTSTFPHVTGDATGVRWRGESQWHSRSADGLLAPVAEGDLPERAGLVAANGSLEIALSRTDDAGDDDRPGPSGGTSVAFRVDGGDWVDAPELLLTGAGGDYAYDVAPVDDGFVVVGARTQWDSTGSRLAEPVLLRYSDGAWRDEEISAELSDRADLTRIAAADSGTRVAVGRDFDAELGDLASFVLTPDADGVWRTVELPGTSAEATVLDVFAGDDTVSLLTFDDEAWALHTTDDGSTFETVELDFGDDAVSIVGAVDLDDTTTVVGLQFADGSSELAVWEITDEGPVPVELAGAPDRVGLQIDSVVEADGRVLAGGIDLGQSVVYAIEIG